MMIRFVCRCGKKLKASKDKIGKKVRCGACGLPVTVPAADTESSDGKLTTTAQIVASLLHVTEVKKVGTEVKKVGSARSGERDATGGISIGGTILNFVSKYIPLAVAVIVFTGAAYWAYLQIRESISERPPLGRVTGQVTLDRKPLAGATILFQPIKDGEPIPKTAASLGRTDRFGNYSLIYVRNVNGAAVGEHRVEIRAPGANGVERVPDKYNTKTELTRIVEPGENVFYFHLKSGR